MKIDSEYLDVEISPEFQVLEATTKSGRDVSIWDDGDIVIEIMDGNLSITMRVEELIEIGRIYKLYKTRRETYLANEKSWNS